MHDLLENADWEIHRGPSSRAVAILVDPFTHSCLPPFPLARSVVLSRFLETNSIYDPSRKTIDGGGGHLFMPVESRQGF